MTKDQRLFDNVQEYRVTKLILQGISNVYDWIGQGNKYEIDRVMTQKFDELSLIYDDYEMLSVEGERDGVLVAEIQKRNDINKRKIVLDPVDGTLTCSKGGSRSISAIAIANREKINFLKVPDNICCFSFGSNINPFFEKLLTYTNFETHIVKEILKSSGKLSTLHRKESKELWKEYIGDERGIITGENTCYLPNELSQNLFKAGDTSIPLFFETDSYIGRSGGTEALIEARLWKYWSGILVSGEKMKNFQGGPGLYLRERVKYSRANYDEGARILFEERELEQLNKIGWTNERIMKPLKALEFSPDYDFIAIASLTGTIDFKLGIHSKYNLRPVQLDAAGKMMTVAFWIKNKKYVGFVDFIYNLSTGEFTWKKRSI